MELVGEYLKEIRLKKNISIEKIAEELKISADLIKAIETNDFDNTPGGVYTIGYIRSISSYLDLNSNEIINQYKKQISFDSRDKKIELPKPAESFNIFLSYKFVSIFAVVFLSGSFYFMFINNNNLIPNYSITPKISENLNADLEEIELNIALDLLNSDKNDLDDSVKENFINEEKNSKEIIAQKNTEVNLTEQSNVIASIPTNNDNQFFKEIITLKSLESTWIQLRDQNDEIVFNKLLKKNDEYSYPLSKKYEITTGNAGNLVVLIDGTVKGKLGKKGEVIESIVVSSELF
tara:strand:+ start:193 stop:1068 length:876 start_codon:yes stop_codon:yes gene_type:complete